MNVRFKIESSGSYIYLSTLPGEHARHPVSDQVPAVVHAAAGRAAGHRGRSTHPLGGPLPHPEPAGGRQELPGHLPEGLRGQRPL